MFILILLLVILCITSSYPRSLPRPEGAAGVAFDHSGLWLGVAGAGDVAVHGVKQDWGVVKTFTDLPKKACNLFTLVSQSNSCRKEGRTAVFMRTSRVVARTALYEC